MGHQDKTSYSVSATRPPICIGYIKMSGRWSQEMACEVLDVCEGRTISHLAGETLSQMTAGVIPPETGKDIFHLGLLLGGIWLDATVIDGLANRKLTY